MARRSQEEPGGPKIAPNGPKTQDGSKWPSVGGSGVLGYFLKIVPRTLAWQAILEVLFITLCSFPTFLSCSKNFMGAAVDPPQAFSI